MQQIVTQKKHPGERRSSDQSEKGADHRKMDQRSGDRRQEDPAGVPASLEKKRGGGDRQHRQRSGLPGKRGNHRGDEDHRVCHPAEEERRRSHAVREQKKLQGKSK